MVSFTFFVLFTLTSFRVLVFYKNNFEVVNKSLPAVFVMITKKIYINIF